MVVNNDMDYINFILQQNVLQKKIYLPYKYYTRMIKTPTNTFEYNLSPLIRIFSMDSQICTKLVLNEINLAYKCVHLYPNFPRHIRSCHNTSHLNITYNTQHFI